MDEWLIRTVMVLYTEACTVVRTDAGLSESFEVNVGFHQGSVLSPLLFSANMDVVSSVCRASLLGKGLKVNGGKSKVMVASSGGKMIVHSGKWPRGVCGKGVQTNYVQCTVCKQWINRRCSGDLSQVADGFMCRRCDGTIQEADLAEDLMVDGETYGCVELLLSGRHS